MVFLVVVLLFASPVDGKKKGKKGKKVKSGKTKASKPKAEGETSAHTPELSTGKKVKSPRDWSKLTDEDWNRIEKELEEGDDEEELKTETQVEIELMGKMKAKMSDPTNFDPRFVAWPCAVC